MSPPMIIMFTLSSMFMINWMLSLTLTLTPPRMANTGLAGVSKTLAKTLSSLPIRSPAHLSSKTSPAMELWAWWAVLKCCLPCVFQEASSKTHGRQQLCPPQLRSSCLLLPHRIADSPKGWHYRQRDLRRPPQPLMTRPSLCRKSLAYPASPAGSLRLVPWRTSLRLFH